jgi:N-methylhydantoinase B
MKALAQTIPNNVIATGFDTTTAFCLSVLKPTGFGVYIEIFGGGYGASPETDGCDAVDSPLSNCSNIPVEATDLEYDFIRVVSYQLEPETFGHGRQRGGCGFSRTYEILTDGVRLSIYADRFRRPAQGLDGAGPGSVGACEVFRGDRTFSVKSKSTMQLQAGDRVKLTLGGGAGFGNPNDRDRSSLQRDIRDGLLSEETAKSVYGYSLQ